MKNKQTATLNAPIASGAPIEVGDVVLLPPDVLKPMPDQPRQTFDADYIRQLADNAIQLRAASRGIRGTGFIDVLKVRLPSLALDDDGHLKPNVRLPIYSGENRYRAAIFANERQTGSLPLLPCIVENLPEDDAYEMAYFANANRRDLSDLEDALALLRIKQKHKFTIEQLAHYVKRGVGEIQNRLDVAQADPDVWVLIDGRKDGLMIARRISTLKKPDQKKLRRDLIKRAKAGAKFKEINDAIKAHNSGVSEERYAAGQEVASYEQSGRREAAASASTAPTKTSAKTSAARDEFNYVGELSDLIASARSFRSGLRGASFTAAEQRSLRTLAAELEAAARDIRSAFDQ